MAAGMVTFGERTSGCDARKWTLLDRDGTDSVISSTVSVSKQGLRMCNAPEAAGGRAFYMHVDKHAAFDIPRELFPESWGVTVNSPPINTQES